MAQETVQQPRVVYVVLTHHKQDQASRLVHAILRSSPEGRVVIYHDGRRSASPSIRDRRVEVLTHAHPTDWGSWEIVLATMEALLYVQTQYDPDLTVLVSGQDYPARPLAEWERQVTVQGGWVGTSWPLHYVPRWGKPYGLGDDEWTRYAYAWKRLPFGVEIRDSDTRAAESLRWILAKIGHYLEPLIAVRVVSRGRGYHLGFRRRRSSHPEFHRGSQWVALDRQSMRFVESQYRSNRLLRRIFTRSIIPDEAFFQTVLASKAPPSSGPLTFVDWIVDADAPKTLTTDDLPRIVEARSPFCRKLEPGVSDQLMDVLDRLSAPD